ncbi:hypothetical protein [Calothrix sp. 336/3]|uniref:hypothetical protein n=1 Tax=Calothrix sp. 336/3 TaxID=1337936 RepID=UPI0004E3AEFD|nr:hypothetical protein [Calothrix sp. 336/3]AKG22502.1 hypothetical protein IJ00_15595 [Calothrix sp. 336/3]
MTQEEIEAALLSAFSACQVASCPLTETQKNIILQAMRQNQTQHNSVLEEVVNPLDKLNAEELRKFLNFVQYQQQENSSWKAQLLNDWLHENDSGAVQFLRDRYGVSWLDQIEQYHIDKYLRLEQDTIHLGDRIEVCNALWEWVQEQGPCSREWFSCIVIQVDEIPGNSEIESSTNCIVRFDNGSEYEISGIYEWNRHNWRKG